MFNFNFHWRGGRLSVDFTATFGRRSEIDRLRTPSDLKRWFRDAGVFAHTRYHLGDSVLSEARQLREAIYRIFSCVMREERVNRMDLRCLNSWAARPVSGTTIREISTATFEEIQTPIQETGGLIAIARDAVALLTSHLSSRIKQCNADSCVLLFVDTSRAGNRRWCSMERCGARSKMHTYRKKGPDNEN